MADERDEAVEGVAAEAALELTDREIAIAQGLDPDNVPVAKAEEVVEEAAVGEGDDGGSDVSDAGEADAKDGEDGGKEAAAASTWVTDDVKALAGTYGLLDVDLADLESEGDFLRLARVLERRKPAAGGEAKPAEPVAKPDAAPEVKPAESAKGDVPKIDPQKYIDAGYDEETVALARAAAKMQEQIDRLVPSFERQQKAFEAEQHRRTTEEFHQVLDDMGRYGKSAKLTEADDGKRKRLWEAAAVVAKDIQANGREPPPLKTLLQRAEIVAFGDEIMAERKAELAKRVKSQSSRRRPVGRATTNPGKRVLPGEADDPVAAIMASPDIQKFLAENSI